MNQRFLKVSGHDGLVRDTESKAIVNHNREDYQRYIDQRDALIKRQTQIDKHETDIAMIKDDLAEIKHLLLAALRNKNVS